MPNPIENDLIRKDHLAKTVSSLIKPILNNKKLQINLETIVTKIIIENKKAVNS